MRRAPGIPFPRPWRAQAAFLLACVFAAPAAMACYTVYDTDNRVVYQSMAAPVDMSKPLHETVPQRFPGGFMVFEEGAACQVVPALAMGQGGRATRTTGPLLTDERTARAMNLPHRSLGQGVAVVAPGQVEVSPSVNVFPRRRSVDATSSRIARGTEITELREPAGAYIERSTSPRAPATAMGGPPAR